MFKYLAIALLVSFGGIHNDYFHSHKINEFNYQTGSYEAVVIFFSSCISTSTLIIILTLLPHSHFSKKSL